MRTAKALLVMALPLLAAGCVSGLHSNQSAQQRYVLRAQPRVAGGVATAATTNAVTAVAGAGRASAEDTLQVLPPMTAAGLDSDSIAVIRPGQRLDYYRGSSWAAAVPSMLQMLAIESLRRQGRFSVVESDTGPFDAQYLLSLEVTHFEAEYSGTGPPTVQVALVCTLGRRAARNVVVSYTAHSEVVAGADRMRAVVAAFERATGDALAQMAAAIVPPAVSSTPAAP